MFLPWGDWTDNNKIINFVNQKNRQGMTALHQAVLMNKGYFLAERLSNMETCYPLRKAISSILSKLDQSKRLDTLRITDNEGDSVLHKLADDPTVLAEVFEQLSNEDKVTALMLENAKGVTLQAAILEALKAYEQKDNRLNTGYIALFEQLNKGKPLHNIIPPKNLNNFLKQPNIRKEDALRIYFDGFLADLRSDKHPEKEREKLTKAANDLENNLKTFLQSANKEEAYKTLEKGNKQVFKALQPIASKHRSVKNLLLKIAFAFTIVLPICYAIEHKCSRGSFNFPMFKSDVDNNLQGVDEVTKQIQKGK